MANRVCERCIHYDVCLLHEDNFIDDVAKNGFCGKFKNKADFEEVVRCMNCKHNDNGDCIHPDNITHSYDSEWNEYDHYISIYSDHYCSYGERRDT
jgi:hypothetical protein